MRRALRGAGVLVTAGACGTSSNDTSTPPKPLALETARDKSPDPGVLELDLEAREAQKSYGAALPTRVWTYNGSVPGPLIDAKVGDRLVVHFKNSLPE